MFDCLSYLVLMSICINRHKHDFLYALKRLCLCSEILMMIRKTQNKISNVKGKYKWIYCNIPIYSFFINYQVMNLSFKHPSSGRAFQRLNFRCPSSTVVFPWTVSLEGFFFLNNTLTLVNSFNIHGFLMVFYSIIDHLTLCEVHWTILRAN